MKSVKITFLLSLLFTTHCLRTTGSDDLAKQMNKLRLTEQRTHQPTQHRNIIHIEAFDDCRTVFYSNGDWTKEYFMENTTTAESYNHNSGKVTRETVLR